MTPAEEIDNCPECSELESPCPEINAIVRAAPKRRRFEPRCEAEYYGATAVIADALGMVTAPVTSARWAHGWAFYLDAESSDAISSKKLLRWSGEEEWIHLTRTRKEAEMLSELGVHCALPVGLPFQYVPTQSPRRIEDSVLVMPPHAHWQAQVEMDREEFISEVVKKYGREKLVFCLTPSCYHDGKWIHLCARKGIPWIAGAHPFDASSLYRMRYLFESFGTMVTSKLGSHIIYALFAGIELDFLEPTVPITKKANKEYCAQYGDPGDWKREEAKTQQEQAIVSRLQNESQEKLQTWASQQCGEKFRRSPEEIARMLGWQMDASVAGAESFESLVVSLGWRAPQQDQDATSQNENLKTRIETLQEKNQALRRKLAQGQNAGGNSLRRKVRRRAGNLLRSVGVLPPVPPARARNPRRSEERGGSTGEPSRKQTSQSIQATPANLAELTEFREETARQLGRIEERQLKQSGAGTLQDWEFQVYSQWGEDGILQYICSHINLTEKTFVEFGVESYREANTRWLLVEHDWSGLVIDGSEAYMEALRSEAIYWRHRLTAVASFITRENINELISGAGIEGEIGLLSVDIDGVDYWVWEAITVVNPAIVVAEYNSLFGPERAVTVPYRPDFVRQEAHFSCSYYGASLRALEILGRKKGYSLVGSNSAGNNAFFVRDDLLREPLRQVSAAEAYVKRSFREARNEDGELLFPTFEEEATLIEGLPLVEITE